MNIYDVARLAGVSISTASKALNDRKDVSTATRERVLAVAREIDYHPSQLARGLAQRRTENIGLIAMRRFDTPLFTNPFYSRVMEGMEMMATEHNYNLVLCIVRQEEGAPLPLMPKMVRERSVDGIILLGHMPDVYAKEAIEKKLPTVVIDNYLDTVKTEYVLSDNRSGAKEAMAWLISMGHKKIGIVSGPLGEYSFGQRWAGCQEALKEAGLKANLEAIHEDPWVDWDKWLPEILSAKNRPSAIFCCNDDHAMRLITTASRLGIKVPGDISVVGCDDIYDAESAGLTTVRVEKSSLGRRAVERLMDLIANPEQERQTHHFPTRLMKRTSVSEFKE